MPCRAVALAVLVVSFALPVPAFAVRPPIEVTACGQTVPKGRSAILTTDLVCSTAVGSFGVVLGGGAKLDLQGHTITGGFAGVACGTMLCIDTWCGPTKRSGRCEVSNGTITGAGYEGIAARKVVVRNMTIVNNDAYDVLAVQKADVYGSHLEGSPNAVQADQRLRLFDSTVDGGTIGGWRRVELHSTTVTNAWTLGVYSRDIRLFGSSVTGSLDHPDCGTLYTCADLVSDTQPLVDATSTCERSIHTPRGPSEPIVTWGVCTLD